MSAAQASALIIAGGRGTRFWPESRGWRPKPLFSIDGHTSLIADTVARLAPLTGNARTFVLVSADQHAVFRKALRGLIPPRNLIVEPSARGTAVAIAYGCATIAHRVGDGVVAVMPADHFIRPPTAFRRTLADAIKLATTHRAIVVIGIVPDRPEPGYGYQEVGPRFTDNNPEGGLSLVETSFEVRKRLTNQWGVVAFLDAGSVGLNSNPDFTRPKYGAGFGVRYNLGFAPLRFDIGTPINPDKGDPILQIYISIGQSF